LSGAIAVIVSDDGYEPTYGNLLQRKRSSFLLSCGIASAGSFAFFVVWALFFSKSTPSDVISLIKAPQTPAKVYPQDIDQHDSLEEASVYNHISSTALPHESSRKEVKLLPTPEEPVPQRQEDEHMELNPSERVELENIVGCNLEEEESTLIEGATPPEPLVAPVPVLQTISNPQAVATTAREEAPPSLPSAPPEQTETQSPYIQI
jgi:hypothetical protein